jgi:hypothetical protein
MYATSTYMFYRDVHVNGETVKPVRRILEKQTAGQAVVTPYLFQAQFNIIYIYT